jgi:hypothetical protein
MKISALSAVTGSLWRRRKVDKKTYPDILLERFLKSSARASDKSYQINHWMRVSTIPINDTIAIPNSFSFIVEKEDSFASLQIRQKRITPQLMLLKMKLIEVSPQSNVGGLTWRGFTSHNRGMR